MTDTQLKTHTTNTQEKEEGKRCGTMDIHDMYTGWYVSKACFYANETRNVIITNDEWIGRKTDGRWVMDG